MSAKRFAVLVLIAVAAAHAGLAAPKPAGDAKEGRALALEACTGATL
jgi:hypothetical protein